MAQLWVSAVDQDWGVNLGYLFLGANDQKPNPKWLSSGNLLADVGGWIVLPQNICSNPNPHLNSCKRNLTSK